MAVQQIYKCKLQSGIIVLFVCSLFLGGCGEAFESRHYAQDHGALNSDTQNLQQKLEWKEISAQEWGAQEFIASDLPNGNSGTDQFYAFTLSLPYAKIYDLVASVVKYGAPLVCQNSGVPTENPKSYNAGEIPCGRIYDGTWKSVADVTIPDLNATGSGGGYILRAFSFPVLISRQQSSGLYSELSLDQKANMSKMSSNQFIKDVSVQYIPQGNYTALKVCANLPGLRISIPDRTIHGTVKKRLLGIPISLSGSGVAQFGEYRYAYARGCAQVNFSYDSNLKKPIVQLASYEAPKAVQAYYTGFRIRFNEWWLRLLDKVADLFGPSLHQAIERAVNRKVNDFSKNEVESGAWMDRLVRDSLRENISKSTLNVASTQIGVHGIPLGTKALKEKLTRSCVKLRLFKSLPDSLNEFSQRCEDFVNDVEVLVNPFYRDPVMAQKGCYTNMAGIFETKYSNGMEKWWAKECAFKVRAQIRVPKVRQPDISAFMAMLDLERKELALRDDLAEVARRVQKTGVEILAIADQILREMPQIHDADSLKSEIASRLLR